MLDINTTEKSSCVEPLSSEETRILALSMHIMRAVAEQHGGTAQRNSQTDKIEIRVPAESKDACAEEIAQQLGLIRKQILTPLVALICGKLIVCANSN